MESISAWEIYDQIYILQSTFWQFYEWLLRRWSGKSTLGAIALVQVRDDKGFGLRQ